MYHPIVKEQVLPGQLEELQTKPHPTETHFQSQALILGKKHARLEQVLTKIHRRFPHFYPAHAHIAKHLRSEASP